MSNPKYNYKIFNTVSKKYMSGSNGKRVWHREYTVVDYLKDYKNVEFRGLTLSDIKNIEILTKNLEEHYSNKFLKCVGLNYANFLK